MPMDRADWDYRTANTKEYTHGIHPYPAMMIPQVARRLIQTYGREGDTLFDPYCGSGTTLLEGMLAGMSAAGTDLNPLARLIAKTKTTPVDVDVIGNAIKSFRAYGLKASVAGHSVVRHPCIRNVDYWFSSNAQRDLALTLRYIKEIDDPRVSDFFKVAFSLTVRKVSWVKQSEFKLVRIPAERLENYSPDVFSVMTEVLMDNQKAFVSLGNALADARYVPLVCGFNSVSGIPFSVYAPQSVDIVVTSPPYGDSKTTVAYGQFSRLSSQWLGYENANQVDNLLMGGGRSNGTVVFGVERLDDVLKEIAVADTKRAGEVVAFFKDYRQSICNIAEVMKPGGFACFVVGNRRVKGFEIPTAETTVEFFRANGFEHVDTFYRNIPNKRMPSLNSPTNVPGKKGQTMKLEHIVICRKGN